MSGFWRTLRHRDLRLLLTAFVVDSLGGWAYNVVLVVHVWERTGSPAWIALTTASSWVPRLLVSAHAGALADRLQRRRAMVLSALASSAVALGLTVVVATDAPLPLLLALSALLAVCASPFSPSAAGLVPDVVPERELVAANGLFGTLENLVVVLGPALGGLLLLTGEPAVGVGTMAGTFLLSAVVVSRVRTRGEVEQPEEPQGLTAALLDGVRALRKDRVAVVLVAFCALDSGVYGASTVLYVPVAEEVGLGAEGYGALLAAAAVGGALSAPFVDRVARGARLTVVLLGGMWVLALPLAATALVSTPVLALGLQVVAGTGMIVVDVLAISALQRSLPRDLLGRVFGLLDGATLGATVLASALTGLLLRVVDLRPALVVVGLAFAGAALLGLPAVRRAEARAAAESAALAPLADRLEELDLLDGAPRPALEQLARAVEVQRLDDGEVLLREGDAADALYVLDSGLLRVTARSADGAAVLLREQQAGTTVGEIGVLHGTPRSATVTASGPAVVWRLAAEDVSEVLTSATASPALRAEVGRRLARSGQARTVVPVVPA